MSFGKAGAGALLFAALVAGCGESGPKMYAVSGFATHNGKPLPRLIIMFHPDDRDNSPVGAAVTDETGHFTMAVGTRKGVFPGGYTVIVSDPQAIQGGRSTDDPDYIAATKKYGANSPMHVTIDKDDDSYELKLD
jgi:hypothetical protein